MATPPAALTRRFKLPTRKRVQDAALISSLEARVRTLKQAIRYLDPEEDARLVSLISVWRDAGREIADRLFSILPPPEAPRAWGWDGEGISGNDGPAEPSEFTWDRGAMLSRLGVDPALLGWNAEDEDWDEIEE